MKKHSAFPLKSSILLFVCLLGFLLQGCKKHPVSADFSLKKYEYAAGDALEFDNLSLNSKSCLWELINEVGEVIATYEENNPVIVLSILANDGNFKLRLTTYNEKKDKQSVIEKSLLVKSTKYKLTVNHSETSSAFDAEFKVYIDGQYIGESPAVEGFSSFEAYIPKGLRLIRLVSKDDTFQITHDFDGPFSMGF